MLYSILTSLGVFAAIIGIVAWFVGFLAAVRAFGYRTSQLLSTQVESLQPPGAVTAAEQADRSVGELKRRMLKSMLVFIIAVGSAAGLILLRDWATGRSG
jgi:hypothetical protein